MKDRQLFKKLYDYIMKSDTRISSATEKDLFLGTSNFLINVSHDKVKVRKIVIRNKKYRFLFITIILRKKFEKSKIPDCFFFSFDVTSQNVVCENLIYSFGELAQLVERLVRNQ